MSRIELLEYCVLLSTHELNEHELYENEIKFKQNIKKKKKKYKCKKIYIDCLQKQEQQQHC